MDLFPSLDALRIYNFVLWGYLQRLISHDDRFRCSRSRGHGRYLTLIDQIKKTIFAKMICISQSTDFPIFFILSRVAS